MLLVKCEVLACWAKTEICDPWKIPSFQKKRLTRSIYMGDKGKHTRFQDEIEGIDRRKSSRIIAMEEKKKKQERERKLAMEMKKKNNSVNPEMKDKGKGKATIEVGDDLSYFNKDDKGRKNKEVYQLISSIKLIQESGRDTHNASALETNGSYLNGMPLKKILNNIIDFLQRKDTYELFAEPANLDVVDNYHDIVKQPMDFGTMRAKLHEGMYTNIDHFKRDVFLICSNAINVNPPTSKYHQVAEGISKYAKQIFEALREEPQHSELKEFSQNKRRPSKKSEDGQRRTSPRVSPKPAGRTNATETEKRHMYWPPNKPLVAEVLCGNKPNIQLNENQLNYKESLLRFVEHLGPTAKRVAAKKLEALEDQQRLNDDTTLQNLPENASGTQIIQQQTPQIPTLPELFNVQTLALAQPIFNRPLTNPGFAASLNRIVNTHVGNVNTNLSSSNAFSMVHPTHLISGPQPRPEGAVNLSDLSLMSQTRRRSSMYDMPANILTGNSLVQQHQPWPAGSISSQNPLWPHLSQSNQRESIPGTSYDHAGNFQVMFDAQHFNNNICPMLASYDQVLPQAQMGPHGDGPVPLQEPDPSSSLQMVLGGAINHYGEQGQPEEALLQLPWEGDQLPNLDLGL
ncbi:uncharacterized protein LOC114395946 isoform X1 [Glycine soja]|uniref:Bromodomain and PHD finger-containing protein 3 isoform A n=1 Tax=Glycine soja TaxID=3848 RepID=A0A445FPD0_GLYSO|nr:uncharacterized protein LOC114395946 isoform X1 [Glycine soja]RZB50725.1 Bromodomain and PHD finger-containing protein 3 isoform A [Glycine soja]